MAGRDTYVASSGRHYITLPHIFPSRISPLLNLPSIPTLVLRRQKEAVTRHDMTEPVGDQSWIYQLSLCYYYSGKGGERKKHIMIGRQTGRKSGEDNDKLGWINKE